MLNFCGLELLGRHHSEIDDSRNIARIAQKMVVDGFIWTHNSVINVDKDKYYIKSGKNTDKYQEKRQKIEERLQEED